MQVLSALTKEMVLIAVVNSGCRSRHLLGPAASFPVRGPTRYWVASSWWKSRISGRHAGPI